MVTIIGIRRSNERTGINDRDQASTQPRGFRLFFQIDRVGRYGQHDERELPNAKRSPKARFNGLTSYVRDRHALASCLPFESICQVIWETNRCALHTRIRAYSRRHLPL
jgi:hypothetical protein